MIAFKTGLKKSGELVSRRKNFLDSTTVHKLITPLAQLWKPLFIQNLHSTKLLSNWDPMPYETASNVHKADGVASEELLVFKLILQNLQKLDRFFHCLLALMLHQAGFL